MVQKITVHQVIFK